MTSTPGSECVEDFGHAVLLLVRNGGLTLKKLSADGRTARTGVLLTMLDIEAEVARLEFQLGVAVRPCSGDEQLSAVWTASVAHALNAWAFCLADRIDRLAFGRLDARSRAALEIRREEWANEFAEAARYDVPRLEDEIRRRHAAKLKAIEDDAERLENEFWEFRLKILLQKRLAASLTILDGVSDKQRQRKEQERRERLLQLINRAQLIARGRVFQRDLSSPRLDVKIEKPTDKGKNIGDGYGD